jgi:hypothetical protein
MDREKLRTLHLNNGPHVFLRPCIDFVLGSLLPCCVAVTAATACSDAKGVQDEQAPANSAKGPPLDTASPQWTRVAPRLLRGPDEEAPVDDPALRRTYGPLDMRFQDCTKGGADGSIEGTLCPNGCAVFGPYVAAPADSDVRVSFELHASSKLNVWSDVVSNIKQRHGALEPQTMAAEDSRKFGYRIHLLQGVNALEARVWISAEAPASFKITNFSVSVE